MSIDRDNAVPLWRDAALPLAVRFLVGATAVLGVTYAVGLWALLVWRLAGMS